MKEEITKKVVTCRVIPCDCECLQQDKIYGKGNRVHNRMKSEGEYRCTCCSKEKKA